MRIAITFLTTFLLLLGHNNLYGQRNFELDDLDKIYTLSDPQISPDGKSVLIVVSKPDTTTNINESFIYKIDVPTGEKQQLTFERNAVRSPRWSPSGNSIAFVSADAAGIPQIFVLSINGGEAKKITDSPTGVQQFKWSPNGTTFAFTKSDEIANKEEIEKGYDSFEVKENSMFLKAKPSPSHIWLIPTDGDKAKRLTSGNWTIPAHAPISWSPNGKHIAFQKNESPYSGELVFTAQTVEIANGKISRITTKQIATNAMHKERQPIFSPDGKSIAYQFQLKNVGYGSDIYITPVNGGKEKNLTAAIDRCFFKTHWSVDSKAVFVAANDFNTVSLWMQPLNGWAKN